MPKKFLQFIFINGKGGSGKDTQAELFLEKHKDKADRISTGDIYREAKAGGKYHEIIEPFVAKVDAGGYVANDVMAGIVKQEILERVARGKEIFIFTGFPRTEPQLTEVDKMLAELGQNFEVSSHHIYYSLSDETSRARANFRRESARRRGEAARPDDDPEVIGRRLRTFRNLTEPMIDRLFLEKRLIMIDAERTIEEIEEETSTELSRAKERK